MLRSPLVTCARSDFQQPDDNQVDVLLSEIKGCSFDTSLESCWNATNLSQHFGSNGGRIEDAVVAFLQAHHDHQYPDVAGFRMFATKGQMILFNPWVVDRTLRVTGSGKDLSYDRIVSEIPGPPDYINLNAKLARY